MCDYFGVSLADIWGRAPVQTYDPTRYCAVAQAAILTLAAHGVSLSHEKLADLIDTLYRRVVDKNPDADAEACARFAQEEAEFAVKFIAP